jgi:hypothetical protein
MQMQVQVVHLLDRTQDYFTGPVRIKVFNVVLDLVLMRKQKVEQVRQPFH